MFNDFRWGGISVRGLIRTLLPDVWMSVAMMIITYLAVGAAGTLMYSPEYEVAGVVAVYPDDKMAAADSSADRMDTAATVSGVLSGEAFQSGFKELLDDSEERTISSSCLSNTNLLTIKVVSTSAKDACDTYHAFIEYYNNEAAYLTGNGILNVVVPPEIPLEPSNSSEILNYRLLLTLFMGFAVLAFLAFLYVVSKTYKTVGSVQRQYKDARFFLIPEAPAGKLGSAARRKKMQGQRTAAIRKMAEELRQLLRARDGKSVLITSSSKNEGTEEFVCALGDELASLGRTVLLIEADFENTGLSGRRKDEADLPEQGLLDALGGRCSVKDVCVRDTGKNILTAYAGVLNESGDEQYRYTPDDVKRVMEEAKNLADIVLVSSGVWGGAEDGRIWNSESDYSLAVCAPGKAGFFAEDRLITDLSKGRSEFAGIVLNGV